MQEESGVREDRWGYPVLTSSEGCIEGLNDFYHQVLRYGSKINVILQAAMEDQCCVLANALAAWYVLNPLDGKAYMDRSKENVEKATEYERAVLETLEATDYSQVISVYSKFLESFPRDLVSLKRAQVLSFARGRSDMMLKFASQALHDNLDSPYMHGMLAFALVENGKTNEAEVAARKALSIESNDVWGQHALCHVFQEREEFKQAVAFMETNSGSWDSCGSFLYSHNWWHLAICHLESEEKSSLDNALRIFDTRIWGDRNRERGENDLFMVSMNALGLLLCIDVKGNEASVSERVADIAKCFLHESKWHKEWLLDLLILWSLAKCSYHSEAKQLISSLRSRVHLLDGSEELHETLLSLVSALYEYGRGNAEVVSSLLGSTFNARELKIIGASNEQIRVFGQIWSKTRGKNTSTEVGNSFV